MPQQATDSALTQLDTKLATLWLALVVPAPWFPNASAAGVSVRGDPAVPLAKPTRPTYCCLPASVKISEPGMVPSSVGTKTTV
jgi:hypothetical protein